MKRNYTLFLCIFLAAIFLSYGYIEANKLSTKIKNLEYIELNSSNWEVVGSYVRITSDGSYNRHSKRVNFISNVKTGRIDMVQLNEIIRLLEDVNFYSLNDEYMEPKGASRLRIYYQLSVKTDTNLKSVRFHSESETVPPSLLEIATRIESLVEKSQNQETEKEGYVEEVRHPSECEKAGGRLVKIKECDASESDWCIVSEREQCYADQVKDGKCTAGKYSEELKTIVGITPRVLCNQYQ